MTHIITRKVKSTKRSRTYEQELIAKGKTNAARQVHRNPITVFELENPNRKQIRIWMKQLGWSRKKVRKMFIRAKQGLTKDMDMKTVMEGMFVK